MTKKPLNLAFAPIHKPKLNSRVSKVDDKEVDAMVIEERGVREFVWPDPDGGNTPNACVASGGSSTTRPNGAERTGIISVPTAC